MVKAVIIQSGLLGSLASQVLIAQQRKLNKGHTLDGLGGSVLFLRLCISYILPDTTLVCSLKHKCL